MHHQANIRAIIFDLGGVLLRTVDAQPRLALAERMRLTRRELEDAVFEHLASHQAEVGQMTPKQAWEAITQSMNLPADEIPAFREQFFAGDRVDFGLVEFIQKLRPQYTTALLSNTWVVDLPAFLRDDLHMPDTFDVIISSAQCRVAKPDPAIFRYALEAAHAAPREAIFVDDFEKNITAASALGIHTVHFRDPRQAQDEILSLVSAAS